MLSFDPHGIIGQYGFDLAGYLASRQKPRRLYLQTTDPQIARAVARRFLGSLNEMLVDQEELARMIHDEYQIPANIYDHTDVETAIIPFSRKNRPTPPPADHVVAIAENSLSYKFVLYPGGVPDNVIPVRKWLKQTHNIQQVWGVLDPVFIGRLAIAQAAGHRIPTLHFRVGQQALDNIYVSGPRAWLSYIVILSASRTEHEKWPK